MTGKGGNKLEENGREMMFTSWIQGVVVSKPKIEHWIYKHQGYTVGILSHSNTIFCHLKNI